MLPTSCAEVVFPGSVLGKVGEYKQGEGIYEDGSQLVASFVGRQQLDMDSNMMNVIPLARVRRFEIGLAGAVDASASSKLDLTPGFQVPPLARRALPKAGQLVTGVVTRIAHNAVSVDITHIEASKLLFAFHGVIRPEEIRQDCTTPQPLYQSFRPGDEIRAEILSTSDPLCLFLTTLGDYLGVVHGRSEHGYPLKRVEGSSTTMRCTGTDAIEPRWVALES